MKYKDHIYDDELKTATIWLTEVEPVQLDNLLMILKEPKEDNSSSDLEEIIFSS